MLKFVVDRLENIVGKGGMLITNILSFPHNVFIRLLAATPGYVMIVCLWVKTLPDDKISDWSKLKQIADNTLKCI